MSKSRGNVVNPDGYVDAHGGDALRVHLLATGRWSGTADFREAGIVDVERLFTRLWRLAHGESRGQGLDPETLGRGAARVAAGIEALRFNTAIRALDELSRRGGPGDAGTLTLLLAPFAPYLAEELWAAGGGAYSVHGHPWPEIGGAAPVTSRPTVELVVQADGRVRDRLRMPAGLSAAEAAARAEAAPKVASHLAGRSVQRRIYVPDRLVNVVTKGPSRV